MAGPRKPSPPAFPEDSDNVGDWSDWDGVDFEELRPFLPRR